MAPAEPDDRELVRAALRRAEAAADLLAALDRRIAFVDMEDGVMAELLDGDGRLLKRLTAAELLDLLDALGRNP